MDLATGMATLVPFHTGQPHIPEMLGSFHLDDHNVEEWSDGTKPGTQHHGRKEIGKWTDMERKADIKYQKREDNTKFNGGQEKQRREVIEGKAPDSAFKIIRTQRQVQDTNQDNGSRVSTSSTSYQMSSSNGVRSTSKTTSNKTTSKTVTVSGGGGITTRPIDDFENLKLSYQPLDTSTQRDRIQMSRSRTMGVRRPPTRRHPQAAILSDSNLQDEFGALNPINATTSMIDEKNDRKLEEDLAEESTEEQQQTSHGLKKISPKIRVGFPVEIQMELQSKLRGPASFLGNGGERTHLAHNNNSNEHVLPIEYEKTKSSNALTDEKRKSLIETSLTRSTDCHEERLNQSIASKEFRLPGLDDTGSYFDFNQRRKSYGFESFDNPSTTSQLVRPIIASFEPLTTHSNMFITNTSGNKNSPKDFSMSSSSSAFKSISQQLQPPPSISTSWDLIRSAAASLQMERDSQFSPINSHTPFLSSSIYSNENNLKTTNKYDSNKEDTLMMIEESTPVQLKLNPFIEQDDIDNEAELFSNNNNDQSHRHQLGEYTLDSSEFNSLEEKGDGFNDSDDQHAYKLKECQKLDQRYKNSGSHVLLQDDITNDLFVSSATSPIRRSHKFNKKADETAELPNQMSFRNYYSTPPQVTPTNFMTNGNSNNEYTNNNGLRVVKKMWDEVEPVEEDRSNNLDDRFNYFANTLNEIVSNKRAPFEVNGEDVVSSKDIGDDDEFFVNDKKEFILSKKGTQVTNHKDDSFALNDHSQGHEETTEELDVNFNNLNMNMKKPSQVSQTWISASDATENVQKYARDNGVTTSIFGINDPWKKPLKKVEFCKTEVHFTPEPGKFQIVESDENKPSTIHLYRRRKRGERKSLEFLRNSLLEISGQLGDLASTTKKSGEEDLLTVGSIKENNLLTTKMWANNTHEKDGIERERLVDVGTNEVKNITRFVSLNTPTTNSVPFSNSIVNYNIDDKFTEAADEDNLSSSNQTPRGQFIMLKNAGNDQSQDTWLNSLSLVSNENLYKVDEDDRSASPVHTIFTNHNNDLKIQRYLKQLKPLSSLNKGSDESNKRFQYDQDRREDEDAHFRYDNILYDHGSFVPLATRRSLIEMNNRNRKLRPTGKSMIGTISDNSSTMSNYSLPCSDNSSNNRSDYQPLKLTAMEAKVSTTGNIPKITSVELRYSFDDNNKNNGRTFSPDVQISSFYNNRDQTQQAVENFDSHKLGSLERIPSPVMPSDFQPIQPPCKGRETSSGTPTSSPLQSPTLVSQKPPTPIPPIPETRGAELRDRFYSRNFLCTCHYDDKTSKMNALKGQDTNILIGKRTSPSKSIVKIGGDDDQSIVQSVRSKYQVRDEYRTERLQSEEKRTTADSFSSLHHTWKDQLTTPVVVDGQSRSGASIIQPLTTTTKHLEPEWVSKAKSRENRVRDWTLFEKQHEPNITTEPPWISELRVKNKHSPTSESIPKVSIVYPWQKEGSPSNIVLTEGIKLSQPQKLKSAVDSYEVKCKGGRSEQQALINGRLSPIRSIPESAGITLTNNKSIVDVNSETNSLVIINPLQIIDKDPISQPRPHSVSPGKMSKGTQNGRIGTKVSSKEKANKLLNTRSSSLESDSRNESLKAKKPLQTSNSLNKTKSLINSFSTNNKNSGHQQLKPRTPPPKPPKPPQNDQQRLTINGNSGVNSVRIKKSGKARWSAISDGEDSTPVSTRSNTPIHYHPMVKVSKLPTKPQKNSPTPDGKSTSSSNKTKSHVSIISEAKRVCQEKLEDVHLINSRRTSSNDSPSPENKQHSSKSSSRKVTPKSIRRDTESSNAKKKKG